MRYKTIDLIKYILAIEVVWMHTVSTMEHISIVAGTVDRIVTEICRIMPPVELFFVFSSYFLFSKPITKKRLFNWIKKLFITYSIYSVLYLPQITVNFRGRNLALNILSIVRQYFFTGYGIMGWFVPALIWGGVGVYVLSLIEQKGRTGIIISRLIIGIIILMSLFGSTYYYVIENNPMRIFNSIFEGIGLLRGVIFCYIGYLLSQMKLDRLNSRDIIVTVSVYILYDICLLGIIQPSWGINQRGMVLKYIYVFFLAIVLLKLRTRSILPSFGDSLGKISVVVYFTHSFLINITPFIHNIFVQWIVVSVSATLFGMVFCRLAKKEYKLFKYLI